MGKADSPCSTTLEVHGQRHRGPANDAGQDRRLKRRSGDLYPSAMPGEISQRQGKETEGGDLRIVSHLCSEGEQGGTETGQRRHRGGGSVVPS
jgi:hypothetical protein